MASIKLLLIVSLAVVGLRTSPSKAQQYATLPCPFNSMCSCKIARSSLPAIIAASSRGQHYSAAINGTFINEHSLLLNPDETDDEEDEDVENEEGDSADIIVKDVSCVGVPLASIPVLPTGRITHVDIVSSGLEVADIQDSSFKISSLLTPPTRNRIESLRLMSNRIRNVGEQLFSSMAEDLKSLDLSYNELDEMPVKAMKPLKVLDWANFHSNQFATLDGLGHLWSHLSPTLHALFLGSNDLTSLPRSTNHDVRWNDHGHHSLSLLRQLNWLNLDGNHLTDIAPESLPPKLHTLSAAQNRLNSFPVKSLQHLQELRWFDLRGNFIQQLPLETIRPDGSIKLRLDKLDLGENLISYLPEGGFMFNRSLHIRDLYLDFNRLVRLPESAFRSTNVARLYLAGNGLVHIDEKAFHSLSSTLVLLDLDRNKLRDYPGALDHLKRLRFLYMANNQLSRLEQDDLASFGTHLEALSLAGNHLNELPARALRNCPKLVHLNLAYNMILNVTGDMFQDWGGSLEVLVLKGNQISQLSPRMFRNAKKLRELSLSFNPISGASDEAFTDLSETLESLEMNMVFEKGSIPAGNLLKPLQQLQWLSMEHNRLSNLPTNFLDQLHQLQYLSLEGNRFTNQDITSLFNDGRLRQLRDIRLAYNSIDMMGSRTFHNLPEMTTIVLANNRIHSIQQMAFDNMPKLITLNLAQNRLEHVDPWAFRSLPSLQKIELQSNRLREFNWNMMYNCSGNPFMAASLNLSNNMISSLESVGGGEATIYIKIIDIGHNLLPAFPNQGFMATVAPSSLKKLILRHNRIKNLREGILLKCQDLQVLELSHNLIEDVEKGALTAAGNLQVIDLSHNQLEVLPTGFFANLAHLRIVNLSKNRLRLLPKDLFDGTSVDTLNLAHNHLISLPVNSLSNISSTLVYLDLSYNQIDHLDAVLLSKLTNLVSLNLGHNRLSLLSDNVFSHLNSLVSLDLSYNTIRANFKELFHELQRIKELQLANIGLSRWPNLPLPNLITLNLSSNGLDYRTGDHGINNIVIRLDRIRNIDLSRNRFTMVPSFLWSSTPLLKQLDLSSNPIRIINRDSFAGLTKLQELSLQPLPVLETIDPDSFHSLFFLTQLRMQLWPGPHLSQLLSGLRGLRRLNVEIRGPVLSSHLNYIATLETAPKLKEIEISGSQLKSIHTDVFLNSGIHTSPECTIILKHTSVKNLPERFLIGLEGCASLTLDLRHNALQTIGPQSIRNNNSLSITSTRHLSGGLLLDHNQWLCTCDNAWLGHWLKRWYLETTSIRHPISMLPLNSVSCRDQISLKRKNLVDLPLSENTCVSAISRATRLKNRQQNIDAIILSVISIALFQL